MDKIKTLSIDIETFSDVDLAKCGVYRYVESPAFEILLFGVSVNGGDVVVYDLAHGEKISNEILAALTDNSIIKWAFNAAFERVCLSMYLGLPSGEYPDFVEVFDGVVGIYGTSVVACRCGRSSWLIGTEAERGQRPHQVFLRPLRSYQDKWRQNKKSSRTRSGEMVAFQSVQQA